MLKLKILSLSLSLSLSLPLSLSLSHTFHTVTFQQNTDKPATKYPKIKKEEMRE